MPDLYYNPNAETFDQFQARRNAAPTVAPTVTPPVDPNISTVQTAAKAGIGLNDLNSVLPPQDTNAIRDQLAKDAGYTDFGTLASTVFKPTTSTQKIYNDAYAAAGLDAIKSKIETRRQQLNQATGAINDNPWLSEASRSGKLGSLISLAQGDINQYTDLYKTGLDQVNQLVDRNSTDLHNEQQVRAAQMDFLTKQAEAEAEKRRAANVNKYLPDYLKAKPNEAPKTVDFGGVPYTWNGTTFVKVPGVAAKPLTLSQGETVFDPATGKVIYTAPKTYAPGTGAPSKTEVAAAQKAADKAAAQASIDSRVGTDGFLSKSDYEKFAQAWARAGYGDFDKVFGAFKSPNTN